jgi:hypothetical protein
MELIMDRNFEQDITTLAGVFYDRLNEETMWQNPFDYQMWKPKIIMSILGEEPCGDFDELHQDSFTEEQRQYAYVLYKGLPEFLKNKWAESNS